MCLLVVAPKASQSPDGETVAMAVSRPTSVEDRRDRVRKYIAERKRRRNVQATTRTDSGQLIDWIPRSDDGSVDPPPAAVRSLPPGTQRVRTELEDQPWARGPEGTVPTEGFDLEHYFEHAGDEVPEDPADIFRSKAAPAVDSESRYYVWWRKRAKLRRVIPRTMPHGGS